MSDRWSTQVLITMVERYWSRSDKGMVPLRRCMHKSSLRLKEIVEGRVLYYRLDWSVKNPEELYTPRGAMLNNRERLKHRSRNIGWCPPSLEGKSSTGPLVCSVEGSAILSSFSKVGVELWNEPFVKTKKLSNLQRRENPPTNKSVVSSFTNNLKKNLKLTKKERQEHCPCKQVTSLSNNHYNIV